VTTATALWLDAIDRKERRIGTGDLRREPTPLRPLMPPWCRSVAPRCAALLCQDAELCNLMGPSAATRYTYRLGIELWAARRPPAAHASFRRLRVPVCRYRYGERHTIQTARISLEPTIQGAASMRRLILMARRFLISSATADNLR
jgi:hypothetical protein